MIRKPFSNTTHGVEEPTRLPSRDANDDLHGERFAHPAFGQIAASRSHGGHETLYGSDLAHSAFISIRISTSILNRNLSRDWHFDDQQIIEVAVSEAQWATFVSSLNVGGGVPCTIRRREGVGLVPGLPPTDRKAQFSVEIGKQMEAAQDALRDLRAQIEASGLSSKKASALTAQVERAIMNIGSNVDFVGKQFSEHMEDVVEAAKAEVHGYVQNVVSRSGLSALGAPETPIVALPGKDDE